MKCLMLDIKGYYGILLIEMAYCHLGTSKSLHKSVTSIDIGVEYHLPLYGWGDDSVCPRLFSLKAIMAEFMRLFELPDHQKYSGGY